jgi:hypothetical protein
MFKLIGQLTGMLCRSINMLDHLAEAGEVQTELIRDASKLSADKKRMELEAEITAWEKSQAKLVTE